MSRTENAVKNVSTGLLGRAISILLGFVSRTVFIYCLGNEYLGINGLYTEVLSVLSFAELGFGTALTYAMYKPVANNDRTMVVRLTQYYKKIYRVVVFIVALFGLVTVPLLPYVVKGAEQLSVFHLRLYYLFFLFNTIISYFVTYKYGVVNAHQKNYLITNIDMLVNSIILIVQIIILFVFKSYLAYLMAQSLLLLASKVIISHYLNQKFDVLKEKTNEKLPEAERQSILKNVKGLVIHQFSNVAVHSTDNIIISMFSGMGVVGVGLISNYTMLMNAVVSFLTIMFSNISSGFGNLVASSTAENYRKTFWEVQFISVWLYGFCSIAFFVLIPPFITLWIGEQNLIDTTSFVLIVLNCYLLGQSGLYNNVRIAKGDFNLDKWWSLAQALVNLVVSVIFAKICGLRGVYIGTVVSRLVNLIGKPYATYKFLFETSAAEYYKKMFIYFLGVLFAGVVTYWISTYILTTITVLKFILCGLMVAIVPNVLFWVMFRRESAYANSVLRVKTVMGRFKK